MTIWITALVLGLAGSLHCLGMCGPLVAALPQDQKTRTAFITGRVLYQFGRIAMYTLLGAVFGLLGQSIALAGFQQSLSILCGIVLIAAVFGRALLKGKTGWLYKSVAVIKRPFRYLLAKRTLPAFTLMGFLNGLLPCGLVYFALAAALATGSTRNGMIYMALFGLGTLPAMLGASLTAGRLLPLLPARVHQLVPLALLMVGTLLILRGLALGIPYISPDLSAGFGGEACCH